MCGFSEDNTPGVDQQPEPTEPEPADARQAESEEPGDGEQAEGAQVTVAQGELDALKQKAKECDQYLDMLQRARADLLNYQKRIRKEMAAWREDAIQGFAADLLPILDDFARATAAWDGPESDARPEDIHAFVEGVRMIEDQLYKALAQHAIEPMEAKGKPFDPAYHEAVLQQPSDEYPPGTVMEELRRGFTIAGRVLRAAQVIVAAGAPDENLDADAAEGEAEKAEAQD